MTSAPKLASLARMPPNNVVLLVESGRDDGVAESPVAQVYEKTAKPAKMISMSRFMVSLHAADERRCVILLAQMRVNVLLVEPAGAVVIVVVNPAQHAQHFPTEGEVRRQPLLRGIDLLQLFVRREVFFLQGLQLLSQLSRLGIGDGCVTLITVPAPR